MSLAPQSRLGPYEIVAPIGAGGMGEVYKARDARLDRFVAIKILPAELSGDSDRRRRFEQEARAVAALNHANIVAVYDVGVQDGVAYLVQELVDGESLRGPIARGELTPRKAISLAAQVADALAAAHQAGIVHRDLKPENVMITAQGKAKVLDFGLARQSGALGAPDDETKTVALTQAGVLLGTLGYMSPEQARGHVADARSDIFSFGCVFYEMLTGTRAFQRATAADTLSAVLKEDPAEFPASVPATARQVAMHCLEKDPAHRFQSAQDLAFALSALSSASTSAARLAVSQAPQSHTRRWPVAAICMAALLAGTAVGVRLAGRQAVDLTPQHHGLLVSEVYGYPTPRWSPDGKSIAYATFDGIFLQNLDSPLPNQVVKAPGVPAPFFSPDGLRIWYTSLEDGRSLWSVGVTGGDPLPVLRKLGGQPTVDGAALSPDGRSLVVAMEKDRKVKLAISSPPGAALQPLGGPSVPSNDAARIRVRFSRDGSKLLAVFLTWGQSSDEGVWTSAWPVGKGVFRRVPITLRANESVTNADWLADNRHIVVSVGTSASVLRMGGRLLLTDSQSGVAWPLTSDNIGAADPSVGPDGRIVYTLNRTAYDLVQLPLDGSPPTELLASDWVESFGSWSRAADEVVYVGDRGNEMGIWIASGDGSWQRRVVASKDLGGAILYSPEFSPDGKLICYGSGKARIYVSPAGGGQPSPVTPPDQLSSTPTWSADGKWIAYATPAGLSKVQLGGAGPPVRITDFGGWVPPAWSPDGNWITVGLEGKIGVVSPDGATKRVCFNRPFDPFTASLGWSRDASTLFLLEFVGDHTRLSAFDLQRGAERVIRDYPRDARFYADPAHGASRLYPSRDGKKLLVARWGQSASVWLLEGVTPPRPWWRYFTEARP